jgi:hypothetical protein
MKPFRFLFLVLFCSLFFQCSKKQRVAHKLTGEWEITTYKQTNIEGLTDILPSNGKFIFSKYEELQSDEGQISIDQQYTKNGVNKQLIEKGSYSLTKKGDWIFVAYQNEDGSKQEVQNFSILLITGTDLKFEVVFNDLFHTYILKKK